MDRLLLGEVEAVELHDLGPGGDEVLEGLLLGVGARVDFREGAELRVGAEDEVHRGRGPLHLVGLAVRRMVSRGNRLPLLSTTRLVLSRVAGDVEELDFADADEAGLVGELADHLPIRIQLEELRGGPEVAVAQPIAYDQVPVR